MSSRDYTKCIGNRSVSPRVRLPLAIAVLAICGVALGFGVMLARSKSSPARMAEEAPAATGKPAVAGKPVAQAHAGQR